MEDEVQVNVRIRVKSKRLKRGRGWFATKGSRGEGWAPSNINISCMLTRQN